MNRLIRWLSRRGNRDRRNPADYSFWAGVAVLSCVALAGVLAVSRPSGSVLAVVSKSGSRSAGSDPISSTLVRYISSSEESYVLSAPDEPSAAWTYGFYGATGGIALLLVVYIVRREYPRFARWRTRHKLHSLIQPDDLSESFARLKAAQTPRPGAVAAAPANDKAEIGIEAVAVAAIETSSMHIDATFDVDQAYVPDEPNSL